MVSPSLTPAPARARAQAPGGRGIAAATQTLWVPRAWPLPLGLIVTSLSPRPSSSQRAPRWSGEDAQAQLQRGDGTAGRCSSGSRAGAPATAQLLSENQGSGRRCPLCPPHPLALAPTAPALPSPPAFARRWRCGPCPGWRRLPGGRTPCPRTLTPTRVCTRSPRWPARHLDPVRRHPPEFINSSSSAAVAGINTYRTGGSAGRWLSLRGVGVGPEPVPSGAPSGGCYFRPLGVYKSPLL